MDTCAVETGLLRKKPCGHAAVAKCANCEIALCIQHAVAELSPTKQRTGKFFCAECLAAQRQADKAAAAKAARSMMAGGAQGAKKAPAPAKPAAAKDGPSDDGAIEYTPPKK